VANKSKALSSSSSTTKNKTKPPKDDRKTKIKDEAGNIRKKMSIQIFLPTSI
jgi:hypothetical protein